MTISDDDLLTKLTVVVEANEFPGMGGLSDGLYADYAIEVAKAYHAEKTRLRPVSEYNTSMGDVLWFRNGKPHWAGDAESVDEDYHGKPLTHYQMISPHIDKGKSEKADAILNSQGQL